MYEDLKQYHCASCMMQTGHTVVRESRTRFCAICGTEAKLKPDEVLPPPHVPKPVPYAVEVSGNTLVKIKTEGTPMVKKMTAGEKAEIIRRKEAGEKVSVIADALGKHISVIYYVLSNANKAKKEKKTKSADKPSTKTHKGKDATQAEAGGGFKHALARMVAEAVDARLAGLGLEDLDAKIEAVLARVLK